MEIRKITKVILFITSLFVGATFSMNNCLKRSQRIFTGQSSFILSSHLSKPFLRYMSIETTSSDIESSYNGDIGGKTGGFDLGGVNNSWEFGSFLSKSHPNQKVYHIQAFFTLMFVRTIYQIIIS